MIRTASMTWIPVEDLRASLNQYPGPPLTLTDVTQRLNAIHEEEGHWPDEAFRADCLNLYLREREIGTEMIAIAGAIRISSMRQNASVASGETGNGRNAARPKSKRSKLASSGERIAVGRQSAALSEFLHARMVAHIG